MKKYFLFSLLVAIMPSLCFGASARYTQLVREKQRKMEELEKCMGSSKGLKIAGISTLGLSAVGVAGNIYEANAIKNYDSQIASTDKKIEKTKTEIAEKQAELDAKKAVAATEKTADKDSKKVIEQIADSEFVKKCKELGGTYTTETLHFAGDLLRDDIPVYDGCVFTTSDGLKSKCDTLKEFSDYKEYIYEEKKLCAFVGDTEWKCLNGQETCKSSDAAVVPAVDNENSTTVINNQTQNTQSDLQNANAEAQGVKNNNNVIKPSNDVQGEEYEDCTDIAKSDTGWNEHADKVVRAVEKQSSCEIQECATDFEPSEDRSKCVQKATQEQPVKNEDSIDKESVSQQVVSPKVGDSCLNNDLPDHATAGHYIKSGNTVKCAATE